MRNDTSAGEKRIVGIQYRRDEFLQTGDMEDLVKRSKMITIDEHCQDCEKQEEEMSGKWVRF